MRKKLPVNWKYNIALHQLMLHIGNVLAKFFLRSHARSAVINNFLVNLYDK